MTDLPFRLIEGTRRDALNKMGIELSRHPSLKAAQRARDKFAAKMKRARVDVHLCIVVEAEDGYLDLAEET